MLNLEKCFNYMSVTNITKEEAMNLKRVKERCMVVFVAIKGNRKMMKY